MIFFIFLVNLNFSLHLMDKRALKDGFLVAGEAKQPLLSLMFIKIIRVPYIRFPRVP